MSASLAPVAFLFDVDNTLLDNDRVKRDLISAIESLVGLDRGRRFWELYEDVRRDRDFVDFPRTLERFAREFPEEPGFPKVADAVLSYPYATALFPGALDVLRYSSSLGEVAILTDGDPVYQPAKIARAGIPDVIDGPVLVFDHKEDHLDEVLRRVPAQRYVLVDDKPRILATVGERLGDRVTTLHVCQGKYAHASDHDAFPDADTTIDVIGDILNLDLIAPREDRT